MKKIKIYADGASIEDIKVTNKNELVSGFTTNPSLMLSAGVKSYYDFAKNVSLLIGDKPISFEVLEEDHDKIFEQAQKLYKLSKNVFVKIPIVGSTGLSNISVIKKAIEFGIKINITAVFTLQQLLEIKNNIKFSDEIIISIFAGRIADTGVDPIPIMKEAISLYKDFLNVEILWASPREVLNYYQATEIGCHIITMPADLISKLSLYQKDHLQYSIETSKMFFDDAKKQNIRYENFNNRWPRFYWE